MEKTFTNVGVSTLNGVRNLRVCNGSIDARIKVLHNDGHTQCAFVALPHAMTRSDAFAYAQKNGIANASVTDAVAGVNRTRSELGIGHVARSQRTIVAEPVQLSAYESMCKSVTDMRARAELLSAQARTATDTAAQLLQEANKLERAANAMQAADKKDAKVQQVKKPVVQKSRKTKATESATFGALTEDGNAGAVA